MGPGCVVGIDIGGAFVSPFSGPLGAVKPATALDLQGARSYQRMRDCQCVPGLAMDRTTREPQTTFKSFAIRTIVTATGRERKFTGG
jgi:hypothetical protein